ncbi:hypothetical protein CEUSTIGMA_g13253.t1 [Chlamydomonas eustigma]|uniref:Coenzyme Q-binding protein COQ10 START domain-containing protein n=1 Tax=Chlamydomonas eustigma TaxID=1157962 RepID=A0A250XS02_9CHLO|nr:hypothetical protein CEUSTIGMA_g13253.t1 [Chlamydomonas eustigma]|eukprot:GAX85838.1 hypothetical protein CEUSTIGMA_g13253.t1 [Chlamydomonas eustigma]
MSDVASLEYCPSPHSPDTTSSRGSNYDLNVSNGNGYLSHIHIESVWNVSPSILFYIFTFPSNAALFRDIKAVENREVITSTRGLKVVMVDQIGELRVLGIVRTFRTTLRVTEDERDSEGVLRITFELLKSDVLSKFNGKWALYPIKDPKTGEITGCRGVLEQDVLPAGVPLWFQRLPVVSGILRGISAGAITRLMEDINVAVSKVEAGLAAGNNVVQHVLSQLCGQCKAEAGYTNGVIQSFDLGTFEDSSEEEEGNSHIKQSASQQKDIELKVILVPAEEQQSVILILDLGML